MSPSTADRDLLFGTLALQLNFIDRNAFVVAVNARLAENHKPLGQILQEQGRLTPEQRQHLEDQVAARLSEPDNAVPSADRVLRLLHDVSADDAGTPSLASLSSESGTAHPDMPHALLAGQRYRVLRAHKRGGLGEVFVALDTELHREVALKEIQRHHADNRHSRGRFVREAEITGGLEHPGIVPVYSLGAYEDGRPFYAMRFIKGDNLHDAIKQFHDARHGFDSVEFRQLLRRFHDVCNAVAYAHSRGVLHRDLKPANVMLGDFGETLVVDWGLAKAIGSARDDGENADEQNFSPERSSVQSVTGAALGTPAFRSPEQAEGKLADPGPATDTYSLGATLAMLLTGQPPIPGQGFPPGVPKALAAVCHKAMALRPQDRYPSATALAGEVERWLADEPVSAYRDPLVARVGRWVRKRRTLVATAAAAVAVGMVSLTIGLAVVGGLNRQLEGANADLKNSNRELDVALGVAEKERRVAVAVTEFVRKDLLAQADVRNQPILERKLGEVEESNPNVTVAELLDRAAKGIEGKFRDQPETEAAIRLTIGNAYRALGKYELAQSHLERSLALREKALGSNDLETLISKSNLALLYDDQGHYAKAEPLYLEVIRQRERILGPTHLDTLDGKNNLAAYYNLQGKYALAEPLFVEVLRESERQLGPDHLDTLINKNNLAQLYYVQGKDALAEPMFLEVIPLQEQKFGADHPDTLITKNNLAALYYRQEKYDKAEPLFEAVLQTRQKKQGAEHPSTLSSKSNLAKLYLAQRKYARAEAMLWEVVGVRERTLGAEHPATLTGKNNLASAYDDQGKYSLAEPLYREVLRLREKVLGPEHLDTQSSRNNLAKMCLQLGKYAEAEGLFRQALAGATKAVGYGHPNTQTFFRNLVLLYDKWGKSEKAQPFLQRQLDFLRENAGADAPVTAAAMVELGSNLVGQKKYAEAEPLLVKGYAGLAAAKAMPLEQVSSVILALDRLVVLFDAVGHKDEAAKWRKKLEEAKAQTKE